MINDRYRKAVGVALALVATGCGDEGALGLGGELIPGTAVRTTEILLPASDFLAGHSSLSGFSRPAQAAFQLVSAGGADGVESRALYRPGAAPASIQLLVQDTLRTDSVLTFPSGELVVRIDTARSRTAESMPLTLYRTTERWDRPTATWQLAVDSPAVSLSWSSPGGGELVAIGTAMWEPGVDSLSFPVDSQTIAAWTDTTSLARGALLAAGAEDSGGAPAAEGDLLRLLGASLRLQARPSLRPDTLISAQVATTGTFIYHPEPPTGAGLRVGGVPAWRSYLFFSELLGTLTVPCPGGPAGCLLPLSEATVNFAGLILTPVESPDPFRLERPLVLEARPVILAPEIPLERTPLRGPTSNVTLDPEQLPGGEDPAETVELPITRFVASLIEGLSADDEDVESILALASLPEAATFGFVSFAASDAGAAAPMLRLIITAAPPLEIR